MTVDPAVLEQLRLLGQQRRRLSPDERRRNALAPYIDTANMSRDDVLQAYAAFKAGQDTPQPPEAR